MFFLVSAKKKDLIKINDISHGAHCGSLVADMHKERAIVVGLLKNVCKLLPNYFHLE